MRILSFFCMNQEYYLRAIGQQLDSIATIRRSIAFEKNHGTNLGVRQYQHLLNKYLAELAELMDAAPANIKHEVIAHQE